MLQNKKLQLLKLILSGWTNELANWWIKYAPEWGQNDPFLKKYLSQYPYNDIYGKWLSDKNICRKIYSDCQSHFPKTYFLLYKRYGKLEIIDLSPHENRTSLDEFLAFIKKTKQVFITKTRGLCGFCVSYKDNTFYKNDSPLNTEELLLLLNNPDGIWLVEEQLYPLSPITIHRVICTRDESNTLQIAQGYTKKIDYIDLDSDEYYTHKTEVDDNFGIKPFHILDYDIDKEIKNYSKEMLSLVNELGRITPQIQVAGIDFFTYNNNLYIMNTTDLPGYPVGYGFSEKLQNDLNRYWSESPHDQITPFSIIRKKSSTIFWIVFTKLFSRLPMRPLVFKEYFSLIMKDLFSSNGISLWKKISTHKQGFLSYRIAQYNITEENRHEHISDREYAFLKHINTKYRCILEDKLTLKYILNNHSDCFPKYYFSTQCSLFNDGIIPLMDCPIDCRNGIDGIFDLLRRDGTLACKPQQGSHGQGFLRLDYRHEKYYMNGLECSLHDIRNTLCLPNHPYLISEYISLHPVLKEIYPHSVNTMRIIVFKDSNGIYQIGNAYLRFGTSKSGGVDNMGAGGLFAAVNVDTGEFGPGIVNEKNVLKPCINHPDTGIPIHGVLPHWDQVKKDILSICCSLKELEYLGFDVAITEDGIKIPEINRSPDYPMIEKLSPSTRAYLLGVLEKKKQAIRK